MKIIYRTKDEVLHFGYKLHIPDIGWKVKLLNVSYTVDSIIQDFDAGEITVVLKIKTK